jgi:hypothetical protein
MQENKVARAMPATCGTWGIFRVSRWRVGDGDIIPRPRVLA